MSGVVADDQLVEMRVDFWRVVVRLGVGVGGVPAWSALALWAAELTWLRLAVRLDEGRVGVFVHCLIFVGAVARISLEL